MKLSTFVRVLVAFIALFVPCVTIYRNRSGYESIQFLAKRWHQSPCDAETFEMLKGKGAVLLAMMAADDAGAGALLTPPLFSAASIWSGFPGDFTTWGWTSIRVPAAHCDMSRLQFGIEKALQGLSLSTSSPTLKCWYVQHGTKGGRQLLNDQKYTVNGKQYRATGGDYSLLFNPPEGFLMITKQYSPANEAPQRDPPVTKLPALRRSSDIVFGQWSVIAGPQGYLKNIKYIVIWSISNVATSAAIARALDNKGSQISAFSARVSFGADTTEGKALLGTPNGVGVGYLLAQHKEQLGRKTVERIEVFLHESSLIPPAPCLVFHVRDVQG